LADVGDQLREFAVLPTDTPWFQNCIESLYEALLREGRRLSEGVDASAISTTAWACRNLLELSICSRFVVSSKANARRFVDDVWNDTIETFVAFKGWLKLHGGDGSALDSLLAEFGRGKTLMQDSRTNTSLHIDQMAEAVGAADQYAHMNRVTSKLVHQTAFLVLMPPDDRHDRLLCKMLFDAGVRFFLEADKALEGHVERYGADLGSGEGW
jgi:hypothetical protein